MIYWESLTTNECLKPMKAMSKALTLLRLGSIASPVGSLTTLQEVAQSGLGTRRGLSPLTSIYVKDAVTISSRSLLSLSFGGPSRNALDRSNWTSSGDLEQRGRDKHRHCQVVISKSSARSALCGRLIWVFRPHRRVIKTEQLTA